MPRTLTLSLAAACAFLTLAAGSAFAAPERPTAAPTPSLTLTLKPHAADGALDAIDATLVIRGTRTPKGKPLLRMALVAASIPTTRYDGDALTASDDGGSLPLTLSDAAPTPMGSDRDWLAGRASSGAITVRFRALPRQVDATTRPGPLFDLRAEGGGLNGAGLAFLPHLVSKAKYRIRLHWDMSGVPAGVRGVSCIGEGDATVVAIPEALTECYYAAGPLHVYPEGASGTRKFGIYWLSDTPFDVTAVAAQIEKLFAYMAGFFHDAGGQYRVFIRKNPYASGGGTALRRSFMFGWNSEHPPTPEHLEGLLAHEMTHNWPALEGEHGDTSWYSEGTAEYYSILLSWRAGVIDAAEFLKRINGRARGYYQNPLQNLTLAQAEERYWQESNASYVPYGRGWLYLAKTDAQIRAHTQGRHSLDEIVVALAERDRRGESHTVADYLRLLTRELGPQAKAEFERMTAGERLVPLPNTFGPCFRPEETQTRLNDLGFDEGSLLGPKKVIRGLRPGSNAALAGLADGDEVIHRTLPDQDDPNKQMTLTVKRDGAPRDIRFVPEGASVAAWQWVRVAEVSERECSYQLI